MSSSNSADPNSRIWKLGNPSSFNFKLPDNAKTIVGADWRKYYNWYTDVAFTRTLNLDTSHRCLMQCPFCSRQN